MALPFTALQPRTTCRVCGSHDLKEMYNLGDHYISNFVEQHKCYIAPQVPIILDMCPFCHLLQQRYTAPQDLLYTRHYWYRSGTTHAMQSQLWDVVKHCIKTVSVGPGDVILDIGANDGTLLNFWHKQGFFLVGVEPATNLHTELAQRCDVIVPDFWSSDTYFQAVEKNHRDRFPHQAKIITALGMFYDLEDPNEFIADVAKALHPEGIFVAQLMCLKNMINMMDVGNLCHEHLEFYSLYSLELLFFNNGLRIVDVSTNATNGESYRITAVRSNCKGSFMRDLYTGRFIQAKENEKSIVQQTTQFFQDIEHNKEALRSFIIGERVKGKRIWVLGASTKGNTLLQHYGLDYRIIEAAAERSSEKVGKYTVGTCIPIVSEQAFREAQPDYALILPYAFKDEIMLREIAYQAHGGKFIIPLPKMEII